MGLVEIVWSRKRLGNSPEEYFMEHLKSLPTISILHLLLCNLYRMHLGRIKTSSEGNLRENHYTLNWLCRLDIFYLHTQLCSWCTLQKSVRLFEVVFPTWKLAQIRGKFSLQAEGLLHEQINTQNRSKTGTIIKQTPLKFPLNCNLSCHMHD